MQDFKPEYLRLLRRQVDEEINYLVKLGHDTKHPISDCVFCYELRGKQYCHRLGELRRFLSEIALWQSESKPVVKSDLKFESALLKHSDLPELFKSL